MEKHLVDYGRHLVFKVWRGDGDQDEFNDNWEVDARQFTNTSPPLNKAIDLGRLLDDVFPSKVLPIGLENSSKIPGVLIDLGMIIAEEV